MDILEIKSRLAGPMAEVEALMESVLSSDIDLLDATNRTLLQQGGKQFRPVLALLAAGACGGINDDSVRFAAAAELIHNSTLLHDDVVDGATVRRGRPTVMSILNGPAAVLMGDYWLVKAIRCVLDASRYSERVIRLFGKTLSDLAEGELLQMQRAIRRGKITSGSSTPRRLPCSKRLSFPAPFPQVRPRSGSMPWALMRAISAWLSRSRTTSSTIPGEGPWENPWASTCGNRK